MEEAHSTFNRMPLRTESLSRETNQCDYNRLSSVWRYWTYRMIVKRRPWWVGEKMKLASYTCEDITTSASPLEARFNFLARSMPSWLDNATLTYLANPKSSVFSFYRSKNISFHVQEWYVIRTTHGETKSLMYKQNNERHGTYLVLVFTTVGGSQSKFHATS